MTELSSIVSKKGQVVIPATIRKEFNLEKGTRVIFEVEGQNITIKKVPTALDWQDIIKDIPNEDVEFDESGNYDPIKAPNFHDWMVNG